MQRMRVIMYIFFIVVSVIIIAVFHTITKDMNLSYTDKKVYLTIPFFILVSIFLCIFFWLSRTPKK
jgi:uncharacterized BrkB/YihY/UPF0761 family membrane protein